MNGRFVLLLAWPLLLGFDTASQLAFKVGSAALAGPGAIAWLGSALGSPLIVAGILGYVGSFFAWMLILRRLDLSVAFPMTSMSYVTVLIAARGLLGETVDGWRWLGVACIVAGFLVMLGEGDAAPVPSAGRPLADGCEQGG